MIFITFFVFTLGMKSGESIIAYDCGARSLNITTVSLLDVAPCEVPATTVNNTLKYVQLLQMNMFDDVHVVQCKLQLLRTIYHCGMHSHTSAVKHGLHEYMIEISRKRCLELYNTGTLYFDDTHVLRDIRIDQTTTRPLNIAGTVTSDGSCSGTSYSDAYGTWSSVVVIGTLKITIQEYIATVDLNNNHIRLRSGVKCMLSDETCIDPEGGNSFWTNLPRDICKFSHYSVLYEGVATKITDEDKRIIYSLTTQDITFALMQKSKKNVCGYEIIGTEHPKLFIFETTKDNVFTNNKKISLNNLDIFAYTNSKFVFVERYIRTQVTNLYRDVVMHRCRQEREILKNALAIATQSPDQFAYNLMKGPGYMAVAAGEVVHVVKCIPTDVRVLSGDECYAELRVSHNNETKFMTPKTHILKTRGTIVDCNALLPTFYYFNENWYKFLPRPVDARTPEILKPFAELTWKYQDIPTLATSGIYSEQDLQELLNRIMYPLEQPAVINDVTREIRGQTLRDQDGTISKLLNDNVIERLVSSTWDRMWGKFLTFGTVSAGIMAILVIIQGIKMLADILVNGIALHRIYGWSFHLLAAVWSSLTTFLIHLGGHRKRGNPVDEEQALNPPSCPMPEMPHYASPNKMPKDATNNSQQLAINPGKPTLSFVPNN